MKVTNDYHNLLSTRGTEKAWKFDNEDTIFIEDDSGSSWSIRTSRNGGILVRCLGNKQGHDQITIVAQVSNEIVLRSEKP